MDVPDCSPRTWGFPVGALREAPLRLQDRMAALDMDKQQIELRAKVKRGMGMNRTEHESGRKLLTI